jgi:hypothetical protein
MANELTISSGVVLPAPIAERIRAVVDMRPGTTGAVERLREVLKQMEKFLLEQVERLEYACSNERLAAQADNLRGAQVVDFTEERRAFEAQRAREIERLTTEASRLMEAWQRLESEQRQLLVDSEFAPSARLGNREDARAAHAATGVRSPVESEVSVAALVASEDEPLTAERAVLQFQQMRREMQRHRLRR